MEGFLAIIILVFGVLQIILFFKIWGMTNNVRKLTEHFTGNAEYTGIENEIRIAKMQGQTQEQIQSLLAKRMSVEMLKEVYSNYSDKNAGNVTKRWEQVFKNAEIDMPDYLKQIKTNEDVINLYHEKEWEEVLNG